MPSGSVTRGGDTTTSSPDTAGCSGNMGDLADVRRCARTQNTEFAAPGVGSPPDRVARVTLGDGVFTSQSMEKSLLPKGC